jgi:hypothetical protein
MNKEVGGTILFLQWCNDILVDVGPWGHPTRRNLWRWQRVTGHSMHRPSLALQPESWWPLIERTRIVVQLSILHSNVIRFKIIWGCVTYWCAVCTLTDNGKFNMHIWNSALVCVFPTLTFPVDAVKSDWNNISNLKSKGYEPTPRHMWSYFLLFLVMN